MKKLIIKRVSNSYLGTCFLTLWIWTTKPWHIKVEGTLDPELNAALRKVPFLKECLMKQSFQRKKFFQQKTSEASETQFFLLLRSWNQGSKIPSQTSISSPSLVLPLKQLIMAFRAPVGPWGTSHRLQIIIQWLENCCWEKVTPNHSNIKTSSSLCCIIRVTHRWNRETSLLSISM